MYLTPLSDTCNKKHIDIPFSSAGFCTLFPKEQTNDNRVTVSLFVLPARPPLMDVGYRGFQTVFLLPKTFFPLPAWLLELKILSLPYIHTNCIKMAHFINPFTDIGFKKIFGQEVSKDLLIDFLNDLLKDEKNICDIRFLDKELLPEFMGDRGVIYDIHCITESGEQFIVEMQNRQQVNFRERALYYLSRTISH